MTIIYLSLLAGLLSYALRVAPLLLARLGQFDDNHILIRYCTYCANAALGCVVYMVLFHNQPISQWWQHFNHYTIVALLSLTLAFILGCVMTRILLCFSLCIAAYSLLILFGV